MKKVIGVFIFALSAFFLQAQEIPSRVSSLNVTLGGGAESFTGSLAWSKTYGLGSSKRFHVGYGVRFSGFSGSNQTYITAPASLTGDEATIDSLVLENPVNLGLNLAIYLEYYLHPKFSLGFNIDAIGYSFGNSQTGAFQSSDNNAQFPTSVEASPTAFNLLLVGDNDLGYLKSEMFVRYALNEKWSLRGGFDFTFSEYTTDIELLNENARFRYKAGMFFLGASYNL